MQDKKINDSLNLQKAMQNFQNALNNTQHRRKNNSSSAITKYKKILKKIRKERKKLEEEEPPISERYKFTDAEEKIWSKNFVNFENWVQQSYKKLVEDDIKTKQILERVEADRYLTKISTPYSGTKINEQMDHHENEDRILMHQTYENMEILLNTYNKNLITQSEYLCHEEKHLGKISNKLQDEKNHLEKLMKIHERKMKNNGRKHHLLMNDVKKMEHNTAKTQIFLEEKEKKLNNFEKKLNQKMKYLDVEDQVLQEKFVKFKQRKIKLDKKIKEQNKREKDFYKAAIQNYENIEWDTLKILLYCFHETIKSIEDFEKKSKEFKFVKKNTRRSKEFEIYKKQELKKVDKIKTTLTQLQDLYPSRNLFSYRDYNINSFDKNKNYKNLFDKNKNWNVNFENF